MDTELERMIIRLIGDGSSYRGMMQQAQVDTRQAAGSIQGGVAGISSTWSSAFSWATGAIGPLAALAGIGGVIASAFKGVQLAADWESNEIAFSTMLGSVEKGKQMVADLQAFAAATPLNTPDLQRAAKTLLQFGTTGDQILPTLRMLGDVTGGDSQKFNSLALAFGQMSSAGRLMGQDLLQMINVGFNPLQEISRTTGVSMATLKKQMEKGQISVEMVKAAFVSATSEGGQFGGLMEKQSKSISGLFSTMQDDIGAALREIGFNVIDAFNLKGLMQGVSFAAQATTVWLKDFVGGVKAVYGYVFPVIDVIKDLAYYAILINFWPVVLAVKALSASWPYVKIAAAAFWDWIKPVADFAIGAIVGGWNWVKDTGAMAWDWVKVKAEEFWAWIRPVVIAGIGIITTLWRIASYWGRQAWDIIKTAAIMAWEEIVYWGRVGWSYIEAVWDLAKGFFSDFWGGMTGDAELTWESVQYGATVALVFVEFLFENFGRAVELTWAGIKLGAAVAWNAVIVGMQALVSSAGGAGGAIALSLGAAFNNVKVAAQLAINYIRAGWQATSDGAIVAAAQGPKAAAAEFTRSFDLTRRQLNLGVGEMQDIGAAARTGFDRGLAMTAGVIDLSSLGIDETGLRAEFDRLGGELAGDWAAFRDRRLGEIASFQFGLADATSAAVGQQTAQNAQLDDTASKLKEIKDINAVGLFSADALARVEEQMAMINKAPTAGSGRDAARADGAAGLALQRQANDHLAVIARREPAVLQPAGL